MESDGVEEALGGQLRVAVQAASQVAEKYARFLNQQQAERQRQAVHERRESEARYKAQLESARYAVRDVHNPEWWTSARPQDIGDVYRVAHTWKDHDGDIAKAYAHMQRQLNERYGINASAPGADPSLLGHEVARQEGLASREYLEAAALNAQATRAENTAELEARDLASPEASERVPASESSMEERPREAEALRNDAAHIYDSAARRNSTAEAMKAAGVSDNQVEIRMTADRSFAAPAREATRQSGKTSKASKAAKVSGRTQQQQLSR